MALWNLLTELAVVGVGGAAEPRPKLSELFRSAIAVVAAHRARAGSLTGIHRVGVVLIIYCLSRQLDVDSVVADAATKCFQVAAAAGTVPR
jgi:hypothetical protein